MKIKVVAFSLCLIIANSCKTSSRDNSVVKDSEVQSATSTESHQLIETKNPTNPEIKNMLTKIEKIVSERNRVSKENYLPMKYTVKSYSVKKFSPTQASDESIHGLYERVLAFTLKKDLPSGDSQFPYEFAAFNKKGDIEYHTPDFLESNPNTVVAEKDFAAIGKLAADFKKDLKDSINNKIFFMYGSGNAGKINTTIIAVCDSEHNEFFYVAEETESNYN